MVEHEFKIKPVLVGGLEKIKADIQAVAQAGMSAGMSAASATNKAVKSAVGPAGVTNVLAGAGIGMQNMEGESSGGFTAMMTGIVGTIGKVASVIGKALGFGEGDEPDKDKDEDDGMGMLMGPLSIIAGLLEGLKPIQAIMKVVGAIMELALMPLAMVLMAILMPFLMPLLMLLGKIPWKEVFAAIQVMEKAISWGLTAIVSGVIWLAGIIYGIIKDYIAVWTAIIGGIITGVTDIWAGIQIIGGAIIGFWNWMVGGVGAVLAEVRNALMGVWNVITTLATWWFDIFWDAFSIFIDIAKDIWSVITTLWNWFNGVIGAIWKDIGAGIDIIKSILNTIASALSSVGKAVNPENWGKALVGMFQTGGTVPQTGLALVHAGETIIPAGGGGGGAGATINVTVTGNTISNQMDLNNLANQVAQQISNQMRTLRTW